MESFPRVDPSEDNNYSIRMASRGGYIDIVNRLLDDPRVDPGVNNNEVLLLATLWNQKEVMNRLLEDPRVDPTVNNNYIITLAPTKDIRSILLEDPRVYNNPIIQEQYSKELKEISRKNRERMIYLAMSLNRNNQYLPPELLDNIRSMIGRYGNRRLKKYSKRRSKNKKR